MDPSVLTEVYKVGGICLVAVVALFWAIVAVWRSTLTREQRLATRLDLVEDQFRDTLLTCVRDNTVQSKRAADTNEAILDALRARPCLIESGTHRKPGIPA